MSYWKNRTGKNYLDQQLFRSKSNDESYRIQEKYIIKTLEKIKSDYKKDKIKILDFGCGFGRLSHILSALDYVEYYGYDFSESMVETLRASPPAQIKDTLHDRIRVADTVTKAFDPEKDHFDIILTVSVLIHNPPERAHTMVHEMLPFLAPNGIILHIENQHTALSTIQNFWHAGCWCHSFVRYYNGVADVEVYDRLAGKHALYLVKAKPENRESHFIYHAEPEAPAQIVNFQEILMLGVDTAQSNAQEIMAEIKNFCSEEVETSGKLHDLEEEIRISTLKINQLKKENDLLKTKENAENDLKNINSEIVNFLKSKKETQEKTKNKKEYNDSQRFDEVIQWNSARDTIYSHEIPEMKNILHVFLQEFVGIRAAVSSFSGNKLAISANVELTISEIINIKDLIIKKGFSRIVFHGLAENTYKLILSLSKSGLSDIIFLVIHGSPEFWCYDAEREKFFQAIELADKGLVKKLHVMQRGFDIKSQNIFEPLLFNMSPSLTPDFAPSIMDTLRGSGVVFAPSWRDWHKNVYATLAAAATSDHVKHIWHHASDITLPLSLNQKLSHQPFKNREDTFRLMGASSLVLNATIVDCHPMVNIEAQALGRPCVRSNLHLDALENHPYVELTTIENVGSISNIRNVIDAVLSVPKEEIEEMTLDYQKESDLVSRSRYIEFLEF